MRALLRLLMSLPLVVPNRALACSVCFAGGEETRVAYIVMTAVMTTLPLLVIGAGVWWLAKRSALAERENERRLAELRAPGS